MGDIKYFCLVVFKENFILRLCNIEELVKYREKIYYFLSFEVKEKFLEYFEEYVVGKELLKVKIIFLF